MLRRGRGYPLCTETGLAEQVAKGLNMTDVPLEFCLLQGEIAEAFDAWRKGREDVGKNWRMWRSTCLVQPLSLHVGGELAPCVLAEDQNRS